MLTFRKAVSADIEEVYKIYVDAAQYKHRYDDQVWKDGFSRNFVVRSIESDNIICALEDKDIACVFSLEWEDNVWASYDEASAGYLHRLAVANGYHGKDIGKQAIEWSVDFARASGKKYLRLDCPTENKKLCKYYESLGCELVEKVRLPEFTTPTSLYQIKII